MMPVILIIYDALEEKACWLYMQRYLKDIALPPGHGTLTLRLPKQNVLDGAAIETFRQYKTNLKDKIGRENLHD